MSYTESGDFEEKHSFLVNMFSRLESWSLDANVSSAHILEIGGAGGLLGGLLSAVSKRVTVSDVLDSQVLYEGCFPSLLKDKFKRNNFALDLGKIEFHLADATHLPYRDNHFDFVVSQNALEHIGDPGLALREAHRVVKKGGHMFFSFDPIWTADSGSHFLNWINEPWRHLLIDTDRYMSEMAAAGAPKTDIDDFRDGLNRKSFRYFEVEMPKLIRSLKVQRFEMERWRGCVDEANLSHPNLYAASKLLACSQDDLLIRSYVYAIKK